MTPEEERLAEALAIERQYGERAPNVIYERVKALAEARDWDGVTLDWYRRLARSSPAAGRPGELG